MIMDAEEDYTHDCTHNTLGKSFYARLGPSAEDTAGPHQPCQHCCTNRLAKQLMIQNRLHQNGLKHASLNPLSR